MKYLVTGGAGYIGDVVVSELLKLYMTKEVHVVDRLMYTDAYMRPGVQFWNMDIRSDDFYKLLATEKFDAVIHLAAIVGDGACKVDKELTKSTNVDATNEIVRTLETFSPRTKLVYASTCSVYGAQDVTLDENSKVAPLSEYAETKYYGELRVAQYDGKSVSLRLGTLFGLSTEFARIRADLVANILTYQACEGKQLSVFGGDQWRPLLHVRDVGRFFAECAYRNHLGLFVVSQGNYKVGDIAESIVKTVGRGSIKVTDMQFEDKRNYLVDASKSYAAGLLPAINLDNGVAEMASFYYSGRCKDVWNIKHHNAKFVEREFALNE